MTKTLSLRSIDIPQLHRFGIGFDSMFDDLMRTTQTQSGNNYPPHNVIKTGENTVIIEVAVAGFAEGEIDISVDHQTLNIVGAINVGHGNDSSLANMVQCWVLSWLAEQV
jgi:molecular chaperone IbpA